MILFLCWYSCAVFVITWNIHQWFTQTFLTVPQIDKLTTSCTKICFYFLKITVEAEVLIIILFFPTCNNILRHHQQYSVLDHFCYMQGDKENSRNVQWFSQGCNRYSLFLTVSNNIHCFYFCYLFFKNRIF